MTYIDNTQELSTLLESLSTVENNIDRDLHGMLQEDTDLEKDLKAELRDLEALKQEISSALKLDGHIEELTDKAERHLAASDTDLNLEEKNEIVGEDLVELQDDVARLIHRFEDITDGIEKFKQEMKEQENDASTFTDIELEVENLLESLKNAKQDLTAAEGL